MITLIKKKEKVDKSRDDLLLEQYFTAKGELDRARNCFEQVTDPDLIAACVYEINAVQQRYNHILNRLRTENVCNENYYSAH